MTQPSDDVPRIHAGNAPKTNDVKHAVMELGEADQAAVAKTAIQELGDTATADLVSSAIGTLPSEKQVALIDQLAPDQPVTNWIWKTIVATFSVILVAATLALIGAVFMQVENAELQMLLTIFTTTGGILAGFISGRAATSRGRV